MTTKITYILTFLVTFFAGIQTSLIATGVLIVIDTLLGLLAARKTKTPIQSRKLARVLTKMLAYQLLIISAEIVHLYLFPQLPIVNVTLGFIAVTEFLSIAENFTILTGKNFIKYIRDYLTNKLENIKKD